MKELFKAVHRAEVENYLKQLGLEQELKSGNRLCHVCGLRISNENIGTIGKINGKYVLSCDKEKCCVALMSRR